jgi:hypothetical protein
VLAVHQLRPGKFYDLDCGRLNVANVLPRFFKPKIVKYLGTYQDGGLQHNNPISIAQWETRFIWPNKSEPDYALSLGTGTTSTLENGASWWKSRFAFRLFKSFMRTLDSEDAWKRFFNSVAPASRNRYHRLNVRFSGPEPSLDDALQIPELKARVSKTIEADTSVITAILDSIIASIFYFELDSDGLPKSSKSGYTCSGHIFCRLNMPSRGLQFLYNRLLQTSSRFLIQGNPIPCIQTVPKGLPPFRQRVTLHVDSLDASIVFSIRGITSTSKLLSGFPTTLRNLIRKQQLDSPFGTIDHRTEGKPLPAIPSKRSRASQIQQDGQAVKRTKLT